MKIAATVLVLAIALPTLGSAGEGRYQGFPYLVKGDAVWVQDTKTGKVRVCISKGPTDAPECSAWSKD